METLLTPGPLWGQKIIFRPTLSQCHKIQKDFNVHNTVTVLSLHWSEAYLMSTCQFLKVIYRRFLNWPAGMRSSRIQTRTQRQRNRSLTLWQDAVTLRKDARNALNRRKKTYPFNRWGNDNCTANYLKVSLLTKRNLNIQLNMYITKNLGHKLWQKFPIQ